MNHAKELQAILDETMEISRIPMSLYDENGSCIASTAPTDHTIADAVREFLHSDIENQSLGAYHYIRILCPDSRLFVLLAASSTPDAFTIGRLTAGQIRRFLASREDAVTKSGFIHNLVNGNLSEQERERQIKKLKLSPAIWGVFLIECADELKDSYAYPMLEHAFADSRTDFCCELDARRLLLVKDVTNILKDYDRETSHTSRARRKKTAAAADLRSSPALKQFAQTLVDTLRAEALVQTHIGYGRTADSFTDLPAAYQEACTALQIRNTFFAGQDTISYDRLGTGRLIANLPLDVCHAFLYEVFGDAVPENQDEETQNTIQKFYENNLNISETARQLYLHRNTLVYRLERLEKTLGLDIRKFDDAMTFKLAMMILAHIRKQEPLS